MKNKIPGQEEQTKEVSDNDPNCLVTEGIKLHKAGELKEAIAKYEKAFILYIQNNDIGNTYKVSLYLSVLYRLTGDVNNENKYLNTMKEKMADLVNNNFNPEKEIERLDLESFDLAELSDYNGSINKMEQACAISEKYNLNEEFSYKLEGYNINIPIIWIKLSYTYFILGDSNKAFKYANKVLDYANSENADFTSFGALGFDKPISYFLCGDLYARNDYDKALESYNKAIDNISSFLGIKTNGCNKIYENRCFLHLRYKKLDKALETLSDTEYYKNAGEDKYYYGLYHLLNKEYDKSKKYFTSYIQEADIHCPERYIDAITGIGLAEEGLKNYQEAETNYLTAINYIEENRKRLIVTEKQKELLFNDTPFHLYLSKNMIRWKMGFYAAYNDTIFSKLLPYENLIKIYHNSKRDNECFYYSEAIKARILLEALAGKYKNIDYKIPKEIIDKENELFHSKELEILYQEVAQEYNSSYVNSQKLKDYGDKLKYYNEKQEEFLKKLRKEYPEYTVIKHPRPLHLEEVKLNSDEVAIEYQVTDDLTIAWLIKEGKIIKSLTIPVGSEELTNLVNKYRASFTDISDYSQLGGFNLETGKKLYDLLLKDLLSEVKGEKVIIIPDKILGLLPFEALIMEMPPQVNFVQGNFGPYPEGLKYVGDNYNITYSLSVTALNSARLLNKNDKQTNGFFAVADPVFTSTDERITSIAQDKIQIDPNTLSSTTPTINTNKYKLNLMDVMSDKYQIKANRLPLTGELVQDLVKLYPQEIKAFTGLDANEKNIKSQNFADYKYLLFATHGILDKDIPYIKEPALVLSLVKNDEEDGFLTASEVMHMKLNADVVVLSACKTGVGKTVSGEGVMGLGRAFQYAGAKSVLMSLWSVESRSTNIMTEKFFEYLKAGKSNTEALKEARAYIRKEGYEHPFFWSSFILMGE